MSKNTLVLYTSDNGPWNQPKYYKNKKGHPKGSIFWGESGELRNGKGSPYEGGYRLPCIARWPGKIPAGRNSDAIFATIDFLPTFATLSGAQVPKDRIIDGIDQVALLFGKSDEGRKDFFFDVAGVRLGDWKYVSAKANFYGYAKEDDRPQLDELYNLSKDIGEKENLAQKYPEKLQELKKLFESIKTSR